MVAPHGASSGRADDIDVAAPARDPAATVDDTPETSRPGSAA
ncbi:MAG: hypothetical protein ACJ780_21610 [Solirubrobacteraceae bacterium]|jgi:hypothetical protein